MSRAPALTNDARSLSRSASQTIASRLCTRPMRRASPPRSSRECVVSGPTQRVTAARRLPLSPGWGRDGEPAAKGRLPISASTELSEAALAAREGVASGPSAAPVEAQPAVETVGCGPTQEHVPAALAEEPVGPETAAEDVGAAAALEPVGARATPQVVAAGAPEQQVVAAPPDEEVASTEAADDVSAGRTGENVRP